MLDLVLLMKFLNLDPKVFTPMKMRSKLKKQKKNAKKQLK